MSGDLMLRIAIIFRQGISGSLAFIAAGNLAAASASP